METGVARKIVITSGKGGVGKTTVTANLGTALAHLGARVVLIDVDFGLNNLDVVLGLENKTVYDIGDIINGRCRPKQALIQDANRKNLFFLPTGSVNSSNCMTGQQLKLILDNYSAIFDYILIDCPAGIDISFHRAVSCADEAIVVATPNITSLRDADKTIGILKTYRLNKIGLVVNRARGDLMLGNKMIFPSDISALLKTDLMGVIPEEDAVFLSDGHLPKNCDSFKAYKMLANCVHKKTKKVFDVTSKYSGLFGSIRRSLKKSL